MKQKIGAFVKTKKGGRIAHMFREIHSYIDRLDPVSYRGTRIESYYTALERLDRVYRSQETHKLNEFHQRLDDTRTRLNVNEYGHLINTVLNYKTKGQQTALSFALIVWREIDEDKENDWLEKVFVPLLEEGADVNQILEVRRGETFHRTPLMTAAEKSYEECLKAMLIHGKNINIDLKNDKGETALFLAIREGTPEKIVQLLLNHGADPTTQDNKGVTALMRAASFGCDAIILKLLNKVTDEHVRKTDDNGNTALHHYAKQTDSNDETVILTLVARGDAAITNTTGTTAHQIAVRTRKAHSDRFRPVPLFSVDASLDERPAPNAGLPRTTYDSDSSDEG